MFFQKVEIQVCRLRHEIEFCFNKNFTRSSVERTRVYNEVENILHSADSIQDNSIDFVTNSGRISFASRGETEAFVKYFNAQPYIESINMKSTRESYPESFKNELMPIVPIEYLLIQNKIDSSITKIKKVYQESRV